jgi:hypothetical protein
MPSLENVKTKYLNRRGKWNDDEDELLTNGVKIYGKTWVKIAEMIPGRTQRQCRTRFLILRGLWKKSACKDDTASSHKSSPEVTFDMSGVEDNQEDMDQFSESDTESPF